MLSKFVEDRRDLGEQERKRAKREIERVTERRIQRKRERVKVRE